MSLFTRRGTIVRKGRRGSVVKGSFAKHAVGRRCSSGSYSVSNSIQLRSGLTRSEDDLRALRPQKGQCDSMGGVRLHQMVSYDDERQLVRTTVGWEGLHDDRQPDYGAFVYQVHEASKEAENVVDFVSKISTIICNTLFVTVLVGLLMAVPIAMVSVGVKYLSDCPKEPRIPVYLLVGGCFGMIKLLSTLWRNIQYRRYQDIEMTFDDHDSDGAFASTTYRTMDNILFLFLLGWQVAGTYWTWTIWTPHFEQLLHEPSNWCDRTVYMFAVYQLTGTYGIMVLFIMVLCLCSCCYKWCQ